MHFEAKEAETRRDAAGREKTGQSLAGFLALVKTPSEGRR
jgi:hypothetical protein